MWLWNEKGVKEGQGQSRMSRVQNELSFLTFHFQIHSDSRMEGESYLTMDLLTESWAIMKKGRWKILGSMFCLSRHGSFLKPLDSYSLLCSRALYFETYSMCPKRILNERWSECSFP